MERMATRTMPFGAASALTFFYALGYPIGALAVSVMSPMAVLVFSGTLGKDHRMRRSEVVGQGIGLVHAGDSST